MYEESAGHLASIKSSSIPQVKGKLKYKAGDLITAYDSLSKPVTLFIAQIIFLQGIKEGYSPIVYAHAAHT
jgi:hypothetical protein